MRISKALISGILFIGSACSDDDPGPLVASFETEKMQVSAGESIQFSDISGGSPASWFWTFEGGTPATSNEQSPVVMYNSPGVFDVTLRVANEVDTTEVLREELISVELELIEITGKVEKGPYLNGGQLRLMQLDGNLNSIDEQSTSIGTLGVYSFQNLTAVSGIAELQATGAYFNEVSGENSESTLTMSALVDLTDRTAFNINLLTSLEVDRVKFLVGEGLTFESAKNQAQAEVLNIFEMAFSSLDRSEYLSISQDGEANAALLAISSILQGTRTTTEVSELVADISTDIATDGVLDNADLGSQLINEAVLLDVGDVRSNLEDTYSGIDNAIIPDFEEMVNQFREESSFEFTKNIKYPRTGEWGDNILNANNTEFKFSESNSFSMELPRGTSVRIVVQRISGPGIWGWSSGDSEGLDVTTFDEDEARQVFKSVQSGLTIDYLFIITERKTRLQLDFYENGDDTPTFTRTIRTL